MMAPCNFSSDLQASAVAMPTGFNTASLMASQFTNITRQAMVALSVEVDSSTVMSSTQNKHAVLIPPNIVDQAANISNQSLMLQSGVSNSAVIMHPTFENPSPPVSSHPHVLSSLVETNFTFTQKIVIPNSHITNFVMPQTAVSSSYTSDIKPHPFVVSSLGTSSTNRSSENEFTNSLQPKFEVKLQPVFTNNVIPDEVKHTSFSPIPPSDMVFQIKGAHSSQVSAFITECSQVSHEIVSPSSCGNGVNDVSFPSEYFVKVCSNSDSTMSVAADVNSVQQSVKCSMDSSQQHFTRDTDFSQKDSPSTGSFCLVAPNTDSFQPSSACSPQQVACSIDPAQQVTGSTDSYQHVTCRIAASQQVPCSMDSSRQVTCYTESFQQSVDSSQPYIESFQLAVDSSEQVTRSDYSSHHVPPVTDSSRQVALINTVQQVTSSMMDCQNIACISQVPSCDASVQQILSQVTQHVETSTISSQQLVSTMAYSEHVAFSTSSLQLPVLGKDSLKEFATTALSPERMSPEISDFPKRLTCDVKIKPEPVDICDEMSAAYSVMLNSPGAYNSEVKLELEDEKPETVFCDAYTPPDSSSSWSVVSEVETDPLGTYSDMKTSLPAAAAPTPCNQDTKTDPLGIIDMGSEMLPGVCSPQITLLLPPIHLGGEFQNIGSTHSLPDCPFPVNSCTVISNSEIPASNVVPNLTSTGTSDSLHVQHHKSGKFPIPRLIAPKPDPPMNLLAPVRKDPKPKSKPVSNPTPVLKKILPKPSKFGKCSRVVGSSTSRTDIPRETTLFNNLNVLTSSSHVEIQGEKMHVASNSSPDGNCHQDALEAGQLIKVAADMQNDSSQNSSHNDVTVLDVVGATTKRQRAKLSGNRLPPDDSEVFTNDRKDLMSVICKNCNSKETNVTSRYPAHEKAYKCDKCQKPCYQYVFKYKYFHAAIKDGKVLEQSHKCSNDISSNTKVKAQLCRGKYNNYKYVCDICGISYKTTIGFNSHYSEHTKVFRYRCDECGKGFHYRSSYFRHRKRQPNHFAKVTFPCERCGTIFYRIRCYRHHQRIVHKVVTGVQCPTCLKYFLNLNQHLCAPFYDCDACGIRFKARRNYRMHVRNHSADIMKHTCKVCNKVYPGKITLNRHMRLHANSWSERFPFLCEVCGRSFRSLEVWKNHRD